MKIKLFGIVIAIMVVYGDAARPQKVLLSVYYESKCPDSEKFIVGQLQPAIRQLSNDVILRLVPFGKAHSIDNGFGGFKCQHGPSECLGNIVQDCALYFMRNATDIAKVEYVVCEMVTQAGTRGDLLCVERANLSLDLVHECIINEPGMAIQLLSEYLTQQVQPSFIPTITFNDVFDQELQDQAMTDLIGAICSVSKGPYCGQYHNSKALKYLLNNNYWRNNRYRIQ